MLPYCTIGRGARLKKVVLDRGVNIPEGLVVGEDPAFDAQWFRRTEGGVTLITQPMIDKYLARPMIEVLSVASEAYPLIKTGGLADVAGRACRRHCAARRGDARAAAGLPGGDGRARRTAQSSPTMPTSSAAPARLLAGRAGGLDIIAVNAPHLYDRPGNPYVGPDGKDWPDNWQRFAALSFAAYELGARHWSRSYQPQILHCHDWQAGLVPAYVAFNAPTRVKTVLTVHNIAFQGHLRLGHLQRAASLDYRAAAGEARSSTSAASASSRPGCRPPMR